MPSHLAYNVSGTSPALAADLRLTDYGAMTITVMDAGGSTVATIMNGVQLPPSWNTIYWYGDLDGGGIAPDGSYRFRIRARSVYGCTGQAWCDVTVTTNWVNFSAGCPPGPGCEFPELNVALPMGNQVLADIAPATFGLSQVITPYAGLLLRVAGSASSIPTLTSSEAVTAVRAQGIRTLQLDVPRGSRAVPVQVRVYNLSGRLVRNLVDEAIDEGSFVVGWDGLDDGGRALQPGVYIAVMTAAGFRGVQRLLLR